VEPSAGRWENVSLTLANAATGIVKSSTKNPHPSAGCPNWAGAGYERNCQPAPYVRGQVQMKSLPNPYWFIVELESILGQCACQHEESGR